MNPSIQRFCDVHVHAASVRAWEQTYSQLTSGRLESTLLQWDGARHQVFREYISQRVVQQGVSPRDRVCFALPVHTPGPILFQGREADGESLFVLRGGEEFMFHTPQGTELLAMNFDRALFEQALDQTPAGQEIRALMRQPVIKLPADHFRVGRQRLLAAFHAGLQPPAANPPQDPESSLLQEILSLLTDPACDRRQRHGSTTQSFIVEKCHRLAMTQALNAPKVGELCERLQVSRRTVQNSFRSVAETTPLHYMRSVRLNGVRRALLSTHPRELSIGDAAAQWGFFHLSHFAADYQELFGEPPSRTARAVTPRRLDS